MIYFTGEVSGSSPGWPSCAKEKNKRKTDLTPLCMFQLGSGGYSSIGRAPLLQLGHCDYGLVWGNSLVGFCVKILNSAVVIGFYYGFLTTFSIGPSYLFLLRGQILGKGSETKISATTGFITGQLMMFISIYYAPLHLALSRPHTITVLTLPFAHYLGRTPLPYYYIEEMMQYDDRDPEEVKAAIDWEKEETNEEEEDITVYLSDKKENTFNKKLAPLEKSLVTTLFDYRKWNRPLRYIKNDHFERVVRDENSQFFFQVCQSDGKKRISFTAKMIDNKSIKFSPVDVFENRIRLSDDNRKTKYLTKIYDPFLNGRVRGEIQKGFSPFIPNETDTTNYIFINKIHEHEQVKIYSKEKKTKTKLLLDAIRTDPTNNTIFNRKLCSEINEISKEVPRWSYDLVDELEVLMDASPKESQIRSPKADHIVIFNSKIDSNDNHNSAEPDRNTEFAVVHYSPEPDYFRDLIRGSMLPQRRKTVTYKLF
ncbi:hypothetical protein RYX36_018549 [Vicia faba]